MNGPTRSHTTANLTIKSACHAIYLACIWV